jgi:phosphoribosylaminoimidazolecarboxamide formyltransferase/IMP cyclohydrolase
MSYNNYVTPTPRAARPTTTTEPAVAIIKHANPCGIAVGATSPRRTARRTPATR